MGLADQLNATSLPVPTQDERTMALLAHLLQIFAGFIGPLVIFFVRRQSPFVRFHAMQALVWQICYLACFFGGLAFFILAVFIAVFQSASHPQGANNPPQAFIWSFLAFWVLWLTGLAVAISNTILAVVYGIKANRGEWACYPIFGKKCLPKLAPAPVSASRS